MTSSKALLFLPINVALAHLILDDLEKQLIAERDARP
jgi:hypothetical protein